MTSYAVSVQNTLKCPVSALEINYPKIESKTPKKYRENFSSRLWRAEKCEIFVSPCGFAPTGKILRVPIWSEITVAEPMQFNILP